MTPSSSPNWLPAILASVAGLVIGLYFASSSTSPVADPRDVRAVLDEQLAAWKAGDLERFVATYWDDAELTFFSGNSVMKGREQVLARYRKNYQQDGNEMGTLTFADLDITPLSADRAQARGRWKVVTSKESTEGLFTLVLRRFPEGWKIVHDHTSKADPPKKP